MTLSNKTTMEFAYSAANENGAYIFPCHPQSKKPLISDWPNKASRDPQQINAWWTLWPNAMIGGVTGHKSGFFVVDIDVKDGVDAETKLRKLEETFGSLEHAMKVDTPSGGLHVYLQMPENVDIRNSTGKFGVGIDIRGNGGYIIMAGSTRADGKQYIVREVNNA